MTTPTATPVPSNAAADLLFNAEKIDEAVTSLALTYLDRFGASHKTMAGAVASISAVNIRGAWVTATAYATLDVVSNGGAWYISLDNHTSGATFAGDTAAHWRVYQGVLASDLADITVGTKGPGAVGAPRATLTYPTDSLGAYLRSEVNVFQYIPPAQWAAILAGTSTYDATADINSAITAAIARPPCRVVFPCGKYRLDDTLGPYAASDLTIDLCGSTLDFGAVQTTVFDRLIYFAGTYGATAALTTNAAQGATTLAINSSGFAVGDFVRVYSSTIWDSTRTSTKIGEISVIDTVPSGAAINLVDATHSAYTTAATGTVQKLTMCRNVHIMNGTILGPTANDQLAGIEIRLGLNCSVQRIHSRDVDNHHIKLTDCVLSNVSFCHFHESYENSQAYAVSFCDASQDCLAFGNTMRDVRHAFTTNNNTTTSFGITRRCTIQSNHVFNNVPNFGGSSGDALDTHAGSDDISFIDNTVEGAYGIGINIEARTATARGNRVRGATASGLRFAPYCDLEPAEAVLSDNDIQSVGDGGSTDYGMVIAPSVNSVRRLVMDANRVLSVNNAISLQGTASFKITNFSLAGNIAEIWSAGPGTPGTHGIEMTYCEKGSLTGGRAQGTTRGAELADCSHVSVVGVQAELTGTSGATGYAIRASGSSVRINMTGNTAIYSATGISSTIGVSASGGSSYCGVWSNITSGFGTSASSGGGTGSADANNI